MGFSASVVHCLVSIITVFMHQKNFNTISSFCVVQQVDLSNMWFKPRNQYFSLDDTHLKCWFLPKKSMSLKFLSISFWVNNPHLVFTPSQKITFSKSFCLFNHYPRADCCHQMATIQVVDDAGNVASCSPNISQNFKPPDPSHCNVSNTANVCYFQINVA